MTVKQPHHKTCPYLHKPLAGCRVQEINGQTIPHILEFCGDRFSECPLFRNMQARAGSGEADMINPRPDSHETE